MNARGPSSALPASSGGQNGGKKGFVIRWRFTAFVLGVLFASYGWGVATYRYHVFPFSIVHAVTSSLEIGVPRGTTVERLPVDDAEMLSALGYTDGRIDAEPERSGVIYHDTSQVNPGWNLYYSWTSPGAKVLDMQGHPVHSWNYDDEIWAHVEILKQGGIVAMLKNQQIRRLSKDSEVLWTKKGQFHHVFFVDGDTIWTVGRKSRIESRVHDSIHTLSDYISQSHSKTAGKESATT